MKLTAKQIIKDLRVAKFKFQDEYPRISFWELWGRNIPLKITGEEPKINIFRYYSISQV